jgi:hypothetical protein
MKEIARIVGDVAAAVFAIAALLIRVGSECRRASEETPSRACRTPPAVDSELTERLEERMSYTPHTLPAPQHEAAPFAGLSSTVHSAPVRVQQ